MVAVTRSRALDIAAQLPAEARQSIKALLASEPDGTRKVYAALARKVWSLLVERRFDDEIRDWHDLLHGVKAHIRAADSQAAERLSALADLLRESISLAQTSPAREVAARPRARQILDMLSEAGGFFPRREMRDRLALGNSHLSNVLTQLSAHDLVDRRDAGKEAEFRITSLGRELIGADAKRDVAAPVIGSTEALAARVRGLDKDRLGGSLGDRLANQIWDRLGAEVDRQVLWHKMPSSQVLALSVGAVHVRTSSGSHVDEWYCDSELANEPRRYGFASSRLGRTALAQRYALAQQHD